MQKPFRLLVAVALIAVAGWTWWTFFPSPRRAIRSRLQEVAETTSFENESNLIVKGYNAQKLASFFTLDATLTLDVRGYAPHSLEGRDEIQKAAMGYRQILRSLKVEFVDIHITLDPGEESALVNLTGKVVISGQDSPIYQELNFRLKKVEGKWLIHQVETVKPLTGISNGEHRFARACDSSEFRISNAGRQQPNDC